ncbi:MAG TPA: PepSY domain-containing protein [Chthonomonadaceae bacterium]|nr:PepSY domain-containing protein [Chthonomonadaceae bacterium]
MQSRKHKIGVRLGGLSLCVLLTGGFSPLAQAQGAHSHIKISASQARKIALKKYPGKVEGKIKLEKEEGSWQYAVNIRSGRTMREIMVNASTGKIAHAEVTTKAEEQKEARAEAKAQKAHKTVFHPHL